MALLKAEHLNVFLDGTQILYDLSFELPVGTWVGVLGPNGSGKTTLLRTISGYLPHAGVLLFHDRPVRSWTPQELAREMAFVRQAPSLAFDFTVEELVLLGRAPHKKWLDRYSRADRTCVHEALQRVDLDGFADRSVLSLSGGERQRVLLAQALAQEADLLLLDEPTTHLDVHYQFEFLNIVQGLVHGGRTVLAVFHDLELAARYADTLLVLDHGRLVASGAPREVLTGDLLASVFRMHARLEEANDGTLQIYYEAPVP